MGITHSVASDFESDGGVKSTKSSPVLNTFLAIFNRPKNDQELDSSDSEITVEERNRNRRKIESKLLTVTSKVDGTKSNSIRRISTDLKKINSIKFNTNKISSSKISNKFNKNEEIESSIESESNLIPSKIPEKKNISVKKKSCTCNPECRSKVDNLVCKFNNKEGSLDNSSDDCCLDCCKNINNTNSSEVMHDYRRYSREPPEKDLATCPGQQNMRSYCRACCEQKKLDVQTARRNCSQSQNCPKRSTSNKFCNNRHISDSYVSCKNTNCVEAKKVNAGPSKSAPLNVPKYKTYPPASRVPSEPPAVPSPPPPPLKPQNSPTKIHRDHSKQRNPQSSVERKPSPDQIGSSSENSKQMYNPHNYNYHKQHYKQYPYEEPADSTTYSHETCCSHNCGGYDPCSQHRACRCQCMCDSDHCYQRNLSDDQLSCCSDSTKTDFMNLAYQRTGDYPELVDELENTLSQRNRMRVQKTMQQFEMLSRQNKNLEKPIFDDDESLHNYRRYRKRCNQNSHSDCCRCSCCKANDSSDSRRSNYKSGTETYKSRSESLSKRPSFQPTPFPRSSGYVEKVARYMDPNYNDKKNSKTSHQNEMNNSNSGGGGSAGGGNNGNNGNGSWQMDVRKGEWVKVCRNNQYDFESNYPPLPPRPRSSHIYDERINRHDYCDRNLRMEHPCSCNKCRRNR